MSDLIQPTQWSKEYVETLAANNWPLLDCGARSAENSKAIRQLESDIVEQEHRFFPIWKNFLWNSKPHLTKPARWALFLWFLTKGFIFGGTSLAIATLALMYYQGRLLSEQNGILRAQAEDKTKLLLVVSSVSFKDGAFRASASIHNNGNQPALVTGFNVNLDLRSDSGTPMQQNLEVVPSLSNPVVAAGAIWQFNLKNHGEVSAPFVEYPEFVEPKKELDEISRQLRTQRKNLFPNAINPDHRINESLYEIEPPFKGVLFVEVEVLALDGNPRYASMAIALDVRGEFSVHATAPKETPFGSVRSKTAIGPYKVWLEKQSH